MIKKYTAKDLSPGSKIRLDNGIRCTIISKKRNIKVALGDFPIGQCLYLDPSTKVELIRSACFEYNCKIKIPGR
jgi:hypothetical protein